MCDLRLNRQRNDPCVTRDDFYHTQRDSMHIHSFACHISVIRMYVQVNIKIPAWSTYSMYHAFCSIQHQLKFKWTPSPSLPHVVHLVTFLNSQIRGCIGIWVSHLSCDVHLYTVVNLYKPFSSVLIILGPQIPINTTLAKPTDQLIDKAPDIYLLLYGHFLQNQLG